MINIEDIAINIDGVDYKGSDLDARGKEILRHIVDVRDRTYELQFQLSQLEVLNNAFTEALRTSAPQAEQKEAS